jgi:hypothetical protein
MVIIKINSMKTFIWATIIVVPLLLCSVKALPQSSGQIPDQSKLMQAWVGTWQQKLGKDTVEVWKIKKYGNSFTMDVNLEIKGKKIHLRKNNYTFSTEDGKFKGFQVYYDGSCDTWTGLFTSDKKFSLEVTKNFMPASTVYKYEMVMETPASFTITRFDNGVKVKENKFKKGK